MQYLAGISISFFLFFLLVLKKEKSVPDKILTVWMAVLGIHLLLFYVDYSGISFRFPHLLGVIFPFPLLHGVLLFFYVSALTKGQLMAWKFVLPHFLPFLLLYALATPFFVLSGAEKIRIFENRGAGYEWFNLIQITVIMASGIGYVLASMLLIRKYRNNVQNLFSNTDKKNLQWLECLSLGLGIIWLLVLFFNDNIIFTGVTTMVIFIGFFGINQLPIFQSNRAVGGAFELTPPPERTSEAATNAATDTVRYAKSGLKADEADLLYQRLVALMETAAPYKNNDLTLAELAESLDIHPNYLSQVINEKEGVNFFNYINTLRVQEFIRLASQPESQRYTLLSLAYDCGFNAKSTFNKYFRSVTGKTPSEYFNLPNN